MEVKRVDRRLQHSKAMPPTAISEKTCATALSTGSGAALLDWRPQGRKLEALRGSRGWSGGLRKPPAARMDQADPVSLPRPSLT